MVQSGKSGLIVEAITAAVVLDGVKQIPQCFS